MANPYVVLREEFDDWAILFDPDTGHGFGLNPTGVYVWKLLDGEQSIDEMVDALRRDVEGVPQEAGDHILAFVRELALCGLAGYEGEWVRTRVRKIAELMKLTYEPPKLVDFRGGQVARGDCQSGSGDSGHCGTGHAAGNNCWDGTSPTNQCINGTTASYSRCCTGTTPGWSTDCQAGTCATRCSNCTVGGGLCNFGNGAGYGTTCQTGDGGT